MILSYFRGKSHFEEDSTQNYFIFQPIYRYFKKIIGVGSGDFVYFWRSRGLSDESINSPITSDYIITSKLSYYGTKKQD